MGWTLIDEVEEKKKRPLMTRWTSWELLCPRWGSSARFERQDKREFSILISVLVATGLSISCNLAMDYMGLNLVDTLVDSLPLPLCVSAGDSTNRVGFLKEKKVNSCCWSRRERKVFSTDPRVASGSSFWRGAILLERPRHHPNPGRATTLTQAWCAQGIQEQVTFLKQSSVWMVGVVVSEAKQQYYAKFSHLQNKAYFSSRTSPLDWCRKWGIFNGPLFSKRIINKLSAASRKDWKKILLK